MPNAATEQNAQPAQEMTEEQKRAWAEYNEGVKTFTAIQREENAKAEAEAKFRRIGSMPDSTFRQAVMDQFGYDPLA